VVKWHCERVSTTRLWVKASQWKMAAIGFEVVISVTSVVFGNIQLPAFMCIFFQWPTELKHIDIECLELPVIGIRSIVKPHSHYTHCHAFTYFAEMHKSKSLIWAHFCRNMLQSYRNMPPVDVQGHTLMCGVANDYFGNHHVHSSCTSRSYSPSWFLFFTTLLTQKRLRLLHFCLHWHSFLNAKSLSKKWHATVLQLRPVYRPTFWWRKWWRWITFDIIFARITFIWHRTSPQVDGRSRTLTCVRWRALTDVHNVNATCSWRLVRWCHKVRI